MPTEPNVTVSELQIGTYQLPVKSAKHPTTGEIVHAVILPDGSLIGTYDFLLIVRDAPDEIKKDHERILEAKPTQD